ncbi:MAG TPA: hypothetical protein VHN79_07660 [Lacunisphaera sp.]|nr:hypothetical protein [Lacunisphaera sp.]
MTPGRPPITWLWIALLALAPILLLRSDLAQVDRAEKLAAEGSPAPARDEASPTGYALNQRHFLGTHERGATYRWIAATQQVVADGPLSFPATYQADSPAEGRPQLLPRLYLAWLTVISHGVHLATGETLPLAVERAALWEPVVVHLLAWVGVIVFMGRRHGLASAALAGLGFVLLPPIAGQFLPGTLTPRTWALLLAAYTLALHVRSDRRRPPSAFSVRAAIAAGLALWLDPAIGFSAVLLTGGIGAATALRLEEKPRFLAWSITGALLSFAAWIIDRAPWDPTAGELRTVHPAYALAWLGLGLALCRVVARDDLPRERGSKSAPPRKSLRLRPRSLLLLVSAILLLTPLAWLQLKHGYPGWLYSGAAMRRLTSLDETRLFGTAFAWLARTSFTEILAVGTPVLGTVALLVLAFRQTRRSPRGGDTPWTSAVLLAGLLALAGFKIRWVVPLLLVALPLLAQLIAASSSIALRRAALAGLALLLVGLLAGNAVRRAPDDGPGPLDLQVLIHRHFAHWLASHHAGQPVTVLAPPELSDALVFHGGVRVLMSTAWESYPGQVAASRILSAPEASEAEAVLQSRAITHVVLTSWDPVLPLLVKDPGLAGKDTLYARLQRWVLPRTLRPVPYQLPAVPGFQDQKLAVFKVTPPQDEALALSRLAEYFVEMNRAEPARLAAQALAQAFPDDPNAVLARAGAYAQTRDRARFDRELARLAADAEAGRVPFAWDRRVQRAITLALAGRRDVARRETEACLASATAEDVRELTPLQAYRLGALAKNLDLPFPDPALAELVASLGSEYHPARAAR